MGTRDANQQQPVNNCEEWLTTVNNGSTTTKMVANGESLSIMVIVVRHAEECLDYMAGRGYEEWLTLEKW